EDAGAEQAIALRLEGAIVDRLRLGDFPVRPTANLLGRSQADADGVEIGDGISEIKWTRSVQNVLLPCGTRRGGLQGPAAHARPLAAPGISNFLVAASCGSYGGCYPTFVANFPGLVGRDRS